MTIGSYVPLWPDIQLCKDRLDYRRKYVTLSEIPEISLSESEFLPSLMTCQLLHWAMASSAGWAMGAAWSSPHLPSSFCTALKNQGGWKLMLEAEGSCCLAQWVPWSSLLLSHNGLNRQETGPTVGQDWMLGRRWIIPPGAALVWVSTALPPPPLCSVLWALLLWLCLPHGKWSPYWKIAIFLQSRKRKTKLPEEISFNHGKKKSVQSPSSQQFGLLCSAVSSAKLILFKDCSLVVL